MMDSITSLRHVLHSIIYNIHNQSEITLCYIAMHVYHKVQYVYVTAIRTVQILRKM